MVTKYLSHFIKSFFIKIFDYKIEICIKIKLLCNCNMLYNNTTLIAYCQDNNIELLDDYTNIKINRDYYVKGNCKSILETCNKIFISSNIKLL
jgi:hypothetical protein